MDGLGCGTICDEDFEVTGPETVRRPSGAFLGESNGARAKWRFQYWRQDMVDMIA